MDSCGINVEYPRPPLTKPRPPLTKPRPHMAKPRPPLPTSTAPLDGGWGYVLTVGGFFVSFFLDGLEYSFGVLLPHLRSEFNADMSSLTLAGGLITGVILGMGPITAMMVNKLGCRRVAFVGGIIAAVSLAASTRAESMQSFTVLYGVCAGTGMGLLYLPSTTMINRYFDKKRGVVMGVVTSGSGAGLFVMSIMIDFLIHEYGWRGAYLIISGVYLNLCVCASLMRPLEDNYRTPHLLTTSISEHGEAESGSDPDKLLMQLVPGSAASSNSDSGICVIKESNTDRILLNGGVETLDVYEIESEDSMVHVNSKIEMNSRCKESCLHNGGSNSHRDGYFAKVKEGYVKCDRNDDNHKQALHISQNDILNQVMSVSPRLRSISFSQHDRTKQDTEDGFPSAASSIVVLDTTHFRNSLINIPSHCISLSTMASMTSASLHSLNNKPSSSKLLPRSQLSLNSLVTMDTQDARQESQMVRALSLFRIVRFDLFCIGAFLIQVAGSVPAMLTPSYAISLGLSSSSAAAVVAVLGVSNTIGRFAAGFLANLGLGSVRIYNTGLFMAGLSCLCLPLCTTFVTLVVFAVAYGFFLGAFPPLQSVILVEQLGIALLPASFGIMCLCKAVASVAGPTLAGALFEAVGSYTVPFYFSGGILGLATLLHCVMTFCPPTHMEPTAAS